MHLAEGEHISGLAAHQLHKTCSELTKGFCPNIPTGWREAEDNREEPVAQRFGRLRDRDA